MSKICLKFVWDLFERVILFSRMTLRTTIDDGDGSHDEESVPTYEAFSQAFSEDLLEEGTQQKKRKNNDPVNNDLSLENTELLQELVVSKVNSMLALTALFDSAPLSTKKAAKESTC